MSTIEPPGQFRTKTAVFDAEFQKLANEFAGGLVFMCAGTLTETEVSDTSILLLLAAFVFHSTLHVVDVVDVDVGAHTSTLTNRMLLHI